MKILHTVEFYHPSVGGMQEVVRQLSERLVGAGHVVTVATSAQDGRSVSEYNGVRIVPFRVTGNLVRGIQGDSEAYRQFLRAEPFDVVTNFAAQQWATDLALTMLDQIPGRKVLVPTGFSGLRLPAYRHYFQQMPTWLAKYDRAVYLSDSYQDICFAREHGVANDLLIPNAADEREFCEPVSNNLIRQHLGIPEHHLLVLLVGSHTGLKGHAEAIRIFARADIRNATLLIVANDPDSRCGRNCRMKQHLWRYWPQFQASDKQLIVAELTRQDTVAAYQRADLFLFPSQVECSPLVLFEAMASRTPFLSSDVGNAAEIAAWSGSGSILPTIRNRHGRARVDITRSAYLLEQYAADDKKRLAMAEHGYKVWQRRFTWKLVAEQYEALYRELVR